LRALFHSAASQKRSYRSTLQLPHPISLPAKIFQ
jgi:hypothetical protein